MSLSQRFIKACRAEPVDRVPIWLMRQAGRYLPEYRKLRQEHSFLTLCKTPDLAVEVTLQPIERFGMDAAILFSDILVLPEAMGIELNFDEKLGPRLGRDSDRTKALEGLFVPDPEEKLGFVLESIRKLRNELKGRAALIGFSGAPFTLATYLIEGGTSRHFQATKSFMYQEQEAFHRLMRTLASSVESYLKAQIRAGAEAVQLFDTWAVVLSPRDYREYVLPYMQQILEGLKREGVPTLHFSLGSSTLLEAMEQTGADVLSLDWKIDIGKARALLGPHRAVQGNMDPFALFQPPERLEATVRDILQKGASQPGYVFNLGHGIHPKTPLESVYRMVEIVHNHPVPQEEATRA